MGLLVVDDGHLPGAHVPHELGRNGSVHVGLSRWVQQLFGRSPDATSEAGLSAEQPAEPAEEPAVAAWDDDLFEAVRGSDDDAAFAVLADWLMEQQDPRGTLITAMLAGDAPAPILTRYRAHFWGPLASAAPRLVPHGRPLFEGPERMGDSLVASWRRGFVDRLWVSVSDDGYGVSDPDALVAFFGHPSAWVLRDLTLGGPMHPPIELPLLASVRALRLGDFLTGDECEMSWSELGDWSSVARCFPNLRRLHVQGGIDALTVPDGVERFVLESSTTRSEVLAAVLPRLRDASHVEIWTGDEEYGSSATLEDLEPLFAMDGLRHLGVRNCAFTQEVVERLVPSRALPGLHTLDLSLGTLTDTGAQVLLQQRGAFAHLQRLVLDESFLAAAQGDLAAAFGDVVSMADQKEADDDYTYVSVGE